MSARIYKPAKTAMQSGTAKTDKWVLEFAPSDARVCDPLMGWTGSSDMSSQVRLSFDSLDAARDYADKQGIPVVIQSPKTRKRTIRPGGYGDNFSHSRRGAWTH